MYVMMLHTAGQFTLKCSERDHITKTLKQHSLVLNAYFLIEFLIVDYK